MKLNSVEIPRTLFPKEIGRRKGGVNFYELHHRLVDLLQYRVRSGFITERSLARLVGMSQPHIHNVLKGKRTFSPATADMILLYLRMDLLDLVESEELRERLRG